jgi:hypothetical protein
MSWTGLVPSFAMLPSRAAKDQQKNALALEILKAGTEMPPCSRCLKAGSKCFYSEEAESKRCARCVKLGVSCDVLGVRPGDFQKIDQSIDSLDAQVEDALKASQDAMARVLRLQKQKRFLQKRRQLMLKKGLEHLDNWEEEDGWPNDLPIEQSSSPSDPVYVAVFLLSNSLVHVSRT